MATILVFTDGRTYEVNGDTFHVNREIDQHLIQAKGSDGKNKTVASFSCCSVVGISFAENIKKD